MRKIYTDEEFKNKYMATVAEADHYNGQLTTFVKWLYDDGFYNNTDDNNIADGFSSTCFVQNGKMSIGIDPREDKCVIGLDPSFCYDKLSKCSIIVELPLSKRKEEAFYNFLNLLMNNKHAYREWSKIAPTSWCGSYLHFERKKP